MDSDTTCAGQVPATTLHAHLRQATKADHHRLDHHPVLAPLIRANVTVSDYGDALVALHGVQTALEQQVFNFSDHPPGFQPQSRLAALESDLKCLERSAVTGHLVLAAPNSLAQWIGMLYVLEGARLGGVLISRQLRAHLGAGIPLEFFSEAGQDTLARWQAFLVYATACCPSEPDWEMAGASARRSFSAIANYLDRAVSAKDKCQQTPITN